MKHTVCRLVIIFACIFTFSGTIFAKDLGRAGKTYPVSEPDFLEEVEAKATAVDWKKVANKEVVEEKVRDFRPPNLVSLPRAQAQRTFLVDPTYVLEFDIPDGRGGILYPKGYSFNPLDYQQLRKTVVVIDGDDAEQIEWLEASPYREDITTMIVLSEGSHLELTERFGRQVFYLVEAMARRLKLQAVPSVIDQQNRHLRVHEVFIQQAVKKEAVVAN